MGGRRWEAEKITKKKKKKMMWNATSGCGNLGVSVASFNFYLYKFENDSQSCHLNIGRRTRQPSAVTGQGSGSLKVELRKAA
jgi:hypothetical protein